MSERGNVKWWNNRQGWGFISRRGKPDVYVRHDRIYGSGWKELLPGEEVEFDLREGAKGPYAANVLRVAESQHCALADDDGSGPDGACSTAVEQPPTRNVAPPPESAHTSHSRTTRKRRAPAR